MSLSHAKKLKKEGITILVDYGFIYEEKGFESLVNLEKIYTSSFWQYENKANLFVPSKRFL